MDKSAVAIRLTMPSAERVVRTFAADAPVEELYAFVECYDTIKEGGDFEGVEKPEDFEHEYEFLLVQPIPRKEFDVRAEGTVGQLIGRGGNLIVERTNVESEDEEEEEE